MVFLICALFFFLFFFYRHQLNKEISIVKKSNLLVAIPLYGHMYLHNVKGTIVPLSDFSLFEIQGPTLTLDNLNASNDHVSLDVNSDQNSMQNEAGSIVPVCKSLIPQMNDTQCPHNKAPLSQSEHGCKPPKSLNLGF